MFHFQPPPDAVQLTEPQFDTIERILRICETGSQEPRFGIVGITKDARAQGKIDLPQISYGVGQATQQHRGLRLILFDYVRRGGVHRAYFHPWIQPENNALETDFTLHANKAFVAKLKAAGEDPIMGEVQIQFFRDRYFIPALRWAKAEGLHLPLSCLVVCDSFLGSGGIFPWLRKRFSAFTPRLGGNEQRWISSYVDVRHKWLSTHENPLLRNSNYRTACYAGLIQAGNWMLDRPIRLQGQTIK